MSWIAYALIAPIFWSISNFIDKYSLEKQVTSTADFLFFSSFFGWLFLPFTIVIFGFPTVQLMSLIPILLGIILVYSYGLYIKALAVNETSRVVVLFKLIPVVTLALGFLVLGQTITTIEFLAFLAVLCGAVFVSFEKANGVLQLRAGVWWLLGAIIIWSGIFLVSDWALTKLSFADFIVLDTFGTALAGLLLLLIPQQRTQIINGWRSATKAKFGWFFANNITDLLGQMALKKSLALAPAAGLVTVAIQVQSIYAIVLGLLLTLILPRHFHEDISPKIIASKCIGAACMFGGILLLFTYS